MKQKHKWCKTRSVAFRSALTKTIELTILAIAFDATVKMILVAIPAFTIASVISDTRGELQCQ